MNDDIKTGERVRNATTPVLKLRQFIIFRLGLHKQPELRQIQTSPLFDEKWYRETYPDVVAAHIDPARHYLEHGGFEGRNPSPYFASEWYLNTYKDVREARINPLLHFLDSGHLEGRAPMSRTALRRVGNTKVYEAYKFDPLTAPDEDLDAQRRELEESDLFDPTWYHAIYSDLVGAPVDPAEHFLTTGWRERRNPGPDFDTDWYLGAYSDAIESGMNPLIHYLRHGKAAGYLPTPPLHAISLSQQKPRDILKAGHVATAEEQIALDTALVMESALFDAEWYLSTYPSVAKKGFEPAYHYVCFGGFEGLNPSPCFDSKYYLSRMKSTKAAANKVNPLVHYLREGKLNGLKPLAALEFESRTKIKPTAETAHPPLDIGFPRLLLSRQPIGALRSDDTPATPLVRQAAALIQAFCELSQASDRKLAWQASPDATPSPMRKGEAAPVRSLQPLAVDEILEIADIWLSSDHNLQIRFDIPDTAKDKQLRLFQFSPRGELHEVGATVLSVASTGFAAASLVSPYMPVLIVLSDSDGVLSDVQLLPFPSLCRGGLHFGEATFNQAGHTSTEQVRLYTDSLMNEWRDTLLGPLSVGRLDIACQRASGQERIFSPSLRAWLNHVLHLDIQPLAVGDGMAFLTKQLQPEGSTSPMQKACHARLDASRLILRLPADAVPSLAALFSRRLTLPYGASSIAASHVVCDSKTARPVCAINLPVGTAFVSPAHADATELPSLHLREGAPPSSLVQAPLAARAFALRFPEPVTSAITEILPHNPNRPISPTGTADSLSTERLQAIVSWHPGDNLVNFAASLKRQSLSGQVDDLVFIGPDQGPSETDQARACFFAERKINLKKLRLNHNAMINRAVNDCLADILLLCDASVLLPDPHTLSHLRQLLSEKDVASVACVVMQRTEVRRKEVISVISGGYFPTSVSLMGTPTLQIRELNPLTAFPDMVYPVMANAFRMTLIKRSVWDRLNGLDAGRFPSRDGEVDFALRAAALGYRHLATSMTRAITSTAERRFAFNDTLSLGLLSVPQWQDMLQSAATIREL